MKCNEKQVTCIPSRHAIRNVVDELEGCSALESHQFHTYCILIFVIKSGIQFFPYIDFKNKMKTTGISLIEKYCMQPSPKNNLSYPKVSKRSHPVQDKQ